MSDETCTGKAEGDRPCVLPAGHNKGYVDIPENHRAAMKTRCVVQKVESKAWLGKTTFTIDVVREEDKSWDGHESRKDPRAADLPEEFREALKAWLAQA